MPDWKVNLARLIPCTYFKFQPQFDPQNFHTRTKENTGSAAVALPFSAKSERCGGLSPKFSV